MLTRYKNGTVYIVRGDSGEFTVPLNIGTNIFPKYLENENINVYLGVMEPNQPFENALIRHKYTQENITDNCVKIKLRPNDTCCLLPGKYYYQIKLESINSDGSTDVYTIVDKTQFFITE